MSRPWCCLHLTFPHIIVMAWSIGIFHSWILEFFFIQKHSEAPKNQTVNSKSPITPLPLRCKQETDISRMFRFFQHFGQSQCQRSLLLSWCFCGTLAGPYSGHLGLARDSALWKTGTKGTETFWLCIEKPWVRSKIGDDPSRPFVGVTHQTYQSS